MPCLFTAPELKRETIATWLLIAKAKLLCVSTCVDNIFSCKWWRMLTLITRSRFELCLNLTWGKPYFSAFGGQAVHCSQFACLLDWQSEGSVPIPTSQKYFFFIEINKHTLNHFQIGTATEKTVIWQMKIARKNNVDSYTSVYNSSPGVWWSDMFDCSPKHGESILRDFPYTRCWLRYEPMELEFRISQS